MSEAFSITHGYFERKCTQIREAARIIGVNEPYLSRLADALYDRICADTRLGPIFQAELGEGWDSHLDRMKRFWASLAFNAGGYLGKPVAVHQRLRSVEREDFDCWLALFRATLEDTAPTPDAIQYLKGFALNLRHSFEAKRVQRSYVACVSRKAVIRVFCETH